MIVFPKTEGPFVKYNEGRKTNEENFTYIKWGTIKELWKQAVPGTDATKDKAVENLLKFWKKRTGSTPVDDSEQIRVIPWLTIAREAILDQLSTKSGLQLKLTANAKFIFCRIRAPIKLLEQQAAQLRYRLQLKGEIDPGSAEFWNLVIRDRPVELEEERKLYTKDKANEILQNLYRAGKISPTDLGVDDEKETQVIWSRRVHALERIADQVPVYNTFIAYVPYSAEKHLRYLYQSYPSVRGKTLFRSKDRLYLTKSILDKYFDCEVLADKSRQSYPVLEDIIALHDANRGEVTTIELLQRKWVTFWRPTAKEAGCPYVSHSSYEGEEEVAWYLRLFSQPLPEIRDYFGEKIGLYFAWFGYYIFALIFPALLGIIMEVIISVRGYIDTKGNYDVPTFVILGLMIIWSTIYHGSWSIEERIIALKWGTSDVKEEDNSERPQFRPDPDQPTIRSVINNRLITHFPQNKRAAITFFTSIVTLFAIIFDMGLIVFFFWLDLEVLDSSSFSGITWISSFFIAIIIKVGSFLFKPWAKTLTNAENHRGQLDYEDALVLKVVIFELFNSYAALIYTAFIKGYVLSGCSTTCIADLRQLLIAIIVVRVATNVFGLFLPQIQRSIKDSVAAASKTVGSDNDPLLQQANDDVDENTEYMNEIDRDNYDGTFDDFSYAVFQYGYIMLFMAALPIIALIALLENMIKLRTDGLKLCAFVKRPHVQLAENVGIWSTLMEQMSYMGVVTSVGILVFTTEDFFNFSLYQKIIIFLVTEQSIILVKLFLKHVILTMPLYVKDIAARQEYIEDKFFKGFEDDVENTTVDMIHGKGILSDNIDVDGMNLYDLRKGAVMSEADYQAIEKQEAERRDYNRKLRAAKDKLLEVYKSENFNENTGVGETKHGLPLGRLSVKVLEVQNLPMVDPIYENQDVKVRIFVKGTRKGVVNAGPPLGPLNDTSSFKVQKINTEGKVVINQSLGPFAPIRTQDADVIFDLIDMSPKMNEASVATGSIKLRDLQDQQSKDRLVYLSVRNAKGASKYEAKLMVNLKFEFSKVVPLRNQIYEIQEQLRHIEKNLAMLKSGRKLEDDSAV